MRHFLSPAEQALLDGVSESERETIRALFDELDAHLVEEIDGTFGRGSVPPAQAWWKEQAA